MVNHQFQLKRSLLALLFQLGVLFLLGCIWCQIFPWYIALVFILLAVAAYLVFSKRRKMHALAYLEQTIWSIQWQNQSRIEQVQLTQLLDYHFYMVLYFDQNVPSQIIWCDQVSSKQWKQLKVMAKLI